MAVEFELPVLQISMAAVDKMQGPDALRALWTVFTKTTGALADGPRLENMTWRLWHRQLLLDRTVPPDDAVAAPIHVGESTVEIVSDDDDSGGEWEDDSAPPSRDPTVVPTATHADKPGVNTRRQSSTVLLQRRAPTVPRPRRHSNEPPVLSASQPTPSRPTLTIEPRSNSSPDDTYSSHGTNIGRIISHLLPEKFEVAVPASLAAQSSIPSPGDQVPSTPRTQPVHFFIQSPSTPPSASADAPAHLPPTLMVINPTPRPTPPDTPSTRARAVPTNIPVALSPSATPLVLAAPSTLSQPHLVLLPYRSASDKLVPEAALPLTPTTVTAPDLADGGSKEKIFYVQSPEGAIGSDDGRSHSSSSNSNTTSNVTDAHPTLGGQKTSSISSATTDELASSVEPPSETVPPPTQDVSVPRGINHARTSSGNAAYTRTRAGRGVKASKPATKVPHRGRPNTLVRTISNSSDRSRSGADGRSRPTRQRSVSEEVVEDIEEVEGEIKQTSASTSQTVTSLPRTSPAPNLSMTPAKNAEPPRNQVSRVVSSPTAPRQTPSHVRSPPNMVARASLVAPFTTIASAAPTAPTAHDSPAETPRPPPNNNSSALMGLGRRAVHVETSSDLDLESDSEESWSDDETDNGDTLARAANEASRQRSMFEKITPRPPRNQTGTGLLTSLMNPDPRIFPQAAMRAHNSAQNLAAMRRVGAPNILQTSRSTVAVPKAAAVTAEEVTTHVSVDPTGRAVGGSGSRGLRLQGRPQGGIDEEGSTDEENSMPNELSKTYAQRRLEALATRARVPPPPPMEQVRRSEVGAPTPAPAPAPAPRPAPQQPQATMPYNMDVRPIHSPRTVRRKMIAGELSESLRRNLMWERTSTRFAMGAGGIGGSGLRPLTGVRPGIQTTNSDRGAGTGSRSGEEDDERTERRLALARNKSWANDFHHAGCHFAMSSYDKRSIPTLISLDPSVPATQQQGLHNRWHPDIPSAATVPPGQTFKLHCLDWTGGQIHNNDTADDVVAAGLAQCHYLTGPVECKGAQPGDVLVVDVMDVPPFPDHAWGYCGIFDINNGGGLLCDDFPVAAKAIWDLDGVYATSRHIPGVRFAGISHPGIMGCAPSKELLDKWNQREARLIADQGDGELTFCGAIEMAGIVTLRFTLVKDGMKKLSMNSPIYLPSVVDPKYATQVTFQGISVDKDGKQHSMNATVAYKQAARAAIEYLHSLGYTKEQAYLLISCAPIEAHVASIVDHPNASVTIGIPTEIFDRDIRPDAVVAAYEAGTLKRDYGASHATTTKRA
ncbi:hypothetical protein FRC11_006123 [Ceratobasidium sp. 423]|nr:hypothetical protein FRC11_006123 [Ceratobasidium sp. 423]